jgi:hypothetical protein
MLEEERFNAAESPGGKSVAKRPNHDQIGRSGRWRALRPIISLSFWKLAFNCVCKFARQSAVAALFLTLAIIVMATGNVAFYMQLGGTTVNLGSLLWGAVLCLFCTGIGLLLLIFGFTRWLFVLTAFSRFWLSMSAKDLSMASELELRERCSRAFDEIKARGGFLTRYWLIFCLNMVVPVLVLYLLVATKMAASPLLVGGPLISLPPVADNVLLPVAALIAVSLLIISFLAIPIAATSDLSAGQSVKRVFSCALPLLPQAMVVTACVLIVDALVGCPIICIQKGALTGGVLENQTIALSVLHEIWQGLASIVLLPLSLVPYCELLRDNIDDPA